MEEIQDEKVTKQAVKQSKKKRERAAASCSSRATPSLMAIVPSNRTARPSQLNGCTLQLRPPSTPASQVHPVIVSPTNQPSHLKGAALEASVIRNPGWPRPGLKTLTDSLYSELDRFSEVCRRVFTVRGRLEKKARVH